VLFCHTAHTNIPPHVITVCGVADLHASLAAGMDEREGVVDGVVVHDDTHMSDTPSGVRTGEEHQVAGLHLLRADGDVAGILVTGGATNRYVVLTIDITGEARAVEGVWSLAAQAVAGADEGGCLTEDIVCRGKTHIDIIVVAVKEIEVVDLLIHLCTLYFSCFLFLALRQCDIHRG